MGNTYLWSHGQSLYQSAIYVISSSVKLINQVCNYSEKFNKLDVIILSALKPHSSANIIIWEK